MTHAAWYVVAALIAYVAYAAVVVHKVRMASLRAVRRAARAVKDEQCDLALSLLNDMESIYKI